MRKKIKQFYVMLRTVTYSFLRKNRNFIININTIMSANNAINNPITGRATANTTVNITIKTNINNINNIIFLPLFLNKILVSIRIVVYVAKKNINPCFHGNIFI